MKVGAHLSIAGGFHYSLDKINEIGGNCLQIFSQSPRNWGTPEINEEQLAIFKKKRNDYRIDPIYFHASYLVNLADSENIGKKSVIYLIQELALANKMNIMGTIIHLGSFRSKDKPTIKQYDILFSHIQEILDHSPENTLCIIENAGNKKICCSLEELGFIVKMLNYKRVEVCLDTCHLWAAGYDLSTPELFQRYFDSFDKYVGLDTLELFQVNDSKDDLGSYRDRHENLGEGNIPQNEFRLLTTNPITKDKPMILEVPGFDKKGPDQKNIATMKMYAENNLTK
ncbi:MAG: deoxyribonuclease IV [Candidatus Levybacteria bacterium]|nr:deoxyribonuclease IV [Candidatus Levybacteria bacterium]